MTPAFSDMLHLFACAAHGTQPEKRDYELDTICQKASRQGALPHVLLSVKNLYKDGNITIHGAPLDNHMHGLRVSIIKEMRRSKIVHNAIKKLSDSGIPCCVLKGETLAHLYNNPECRISSDTDVYVEDVNLRKDAKKVFEECGFVFVNRQSGPSDHEYRAYHESAGLLELHGDLYDIVSREIWFKNRAAAYEPYRMQETRFGNTLPALGVNDGFLFVFLHMVKHFINRGVGARQFMDTLLYIKKYRNELDYERFLELIKHLKYDRFFNLMMYIGVNYLGFDEMDLYPYACDETAAVMILNDMEGGGIFGRDEEWREHYSKTYRMNSFDSIKDEAHSRHIAKQIKQNPFHRLFRDRLSMMHKHTYVAKYRFLLPVAWLHKAAIHVTKSLRGNSGSYTEKVNARMSMIRELNLDLR